MAHTPQRKVRMGDPLWLATQWLARHRDRDASVVIRQLLGDWIAREAANDPAVAGAAVIRRYLAGDQAADVDDVDDDQLRGQLVLVERFPPLPRAG